MLTAKISSSVWSMILKYPFSLLVALFFKRKVHTFILFFLKIVPQLVYLFQLQSTNKYFHAPNNPILQSWMSISSMSDFSNFQLIGAFVARLEDFGSAHLCN